MKLRYFFIILLVALFSADLAPQKKESVEITAQSILAQVDRIMQYPEGEIKGRIKHITPDGKAFEVDLKGNISRNNYLFYFSSPARGESLKVLYNLGGEDIWVYNIHAVKLFHKMGIDKYDSVMMTNYTFIDLSNSDFQSNYNARIVDRTLVKGIECYRLNLEPIFEGSEYGLIVMYVSIDKHLPMRIDYYDRDRVIFKFLSLARTMEKDGRIVPIRYDMLNIKDGTVSILSYLKFDWNMKFQEEIFRPEKLGE